MAAPRAYLAQSGPSNKDAGHLQVNGRLGASPETNSRYRIFSRVTLVVTRPTHKSRGERQPANQIIACWGGEMPQVDSLYFQSRGTSTIISSRLGISRYACHSASDMGAGLTLFCRRSAHPLRSIPLGAPSSCPRLSRPASRLVKTGIISSIIISHFEEYLHRLQKGAIPYPEYLRRRRLLLESRH